jgi:hypothetical protein
VPGSLITGILEWEREGGLKSFLKLHEDIAREVTVTNKNIVFYIDTPEDYQELQKRYREDLSIPE